MQPGEQVEAVRLSAELQPDVFEGVPYLSYLPPTPKAVVFVFFPCDEPVGRVRDAEVAALLNPLLAAGWGLLVPECSAGSGARRWDVTEPLSYRNLDLSRALRLEETRLKEAAATTPLYAIGVGQDGAGFASLFLVAARGRQRPVGAGAMVLGGIAATVAPEQAAPSFFAVAENDPGVSGAKVREVFAAIAAAGTPAKMEIVREGLVEPLRFARVDGLDAPASRAVFGALVAQGVLSETGARRGELAESQARLAAVRWPEGLTPEQRRASAQQVRAAWGLGEVNGEIAPALVAFFEENGPR